MAALNRQGSF